MSEDFKTLLVEQGLPTEEAEIKQHFEDLTAEEGLITNTSKMSPFWRLITAIAVTPVKWLTDMLIYGVLPNLFVKTATGKWLQMHAWSVGLDFKEATKAQGVIEFTKQSAVTPVTIKKGTMIQTERINDTIFRVIVVEDTFIPQGIVSALVPVEAELAGSSYNLAGGYYRILPEAVQGIANVVNKNDWLTTPGADKESDEELRQRYKVQFNSVGQHHIDSVYKSMIARVAGLSVDRIYFKYNAPRGPGSANAYLLLDTGIISQPFIDKVNNYITNLGNHGHGDDLVCFAMPETQHTLSCKIYFEPNQGIQDTKKQLILKQVEQMIRCAWRENNNFDVHKTYPFSRFSWSRLGEEIHKKIPSIKSIVWGQNDVISDLDIPRIRKLIVSEV